MHADIDERAERGDVGDDALEHHARLEIVERLDAVLELRRLEGRARIAAGLLQLVQDVGDGRQAELSSTNDSGDSARTRRVADQRLDVALGRGDDPLAPPDRLRDAPPTRRADRRRRGCAGSPRTARTPSGRAAARPCSALRTEGAVRVAVRRRCSAPAPGRCPETRASSGADAVLRSTPTPLTQSSTTASSERDSLNSLRSCWYWPTPIDFGSIFTSSASGSCSRRAIDTAPRKRHVELGQLLRRIGRGRIDRGAGLRHHDLLQLELRAAPCTSSIASLSVSREAVPLPIAISSTLCSRTSRARMASASSQRRCGSCG